MENCNCYVQSHWSDMFGYCMGTKGREACSCQGDVTKCNYYPEKRKKKMFTLEMMNLAKENNKTYRASDCLYNCKLGFHDKTGKEWQGMTFHKLNDLFTIDNWQEDDTVYMTKSEAEKKYNIKIVG